MIVLEGLSKSYARAMSPAVDTVSLDVPEGTTVALIGPSGCGKTTTLRMINRLIEPSAGRILVGGEDVTRIDPVLLRRRIGYVIQQVGLFPNMTIAQNVAAVPDLLGWPKSRIAARVEELLALVGLDQALARRYPSELSGGQRQRVGVARALAADPPVLLMDEPFGAIDPVARTRLQDEFLRILQTVRKTVVMVTHDLDEALRMSHRLAIMRAGRLVQYDTPDAILSRPADAFVESFVGADRAIRRLGLRKVAEAMRPAAPGTTGGASIRADASLRDALAKMLVTGTDTLDVLTEAGERGGVLTRDGIFG